MANLIETGKNYLAHIAERTQTIRDYAGSVANRTIGRAAWREAMQRPSSYDSYYDDRPRWARAINKALNHAAPLHSILELGYPLTSKSILSTIYPEDTESSKFNPYIDTGKLFLALTTDMALWAPAIWLTHNLDEAAALKLATNIAVQIGSDIVSTTVNRIKYLRPHNTTIAA